MRGLFRALFGTSHGNSDRGRPEAIRRQTLAINARIILLLSAVFLPVALFLVARSELSAFVLALIGLATGAATLTLHNRGHFERAAEGQVQAVLVAGLFLTLADPGVVDFGLAVALLAPVQASLFTRSPAKKRAWAMLVVVVALGTLGSLDIIGLPAKFASGIGTIDVACFIMLALIVAYSGHRLNGAFEVYERGQINAYRHLIENVQDAVLRFGATGAVLFASKSAEKLFGCQRYELSGQGLFERLHILDRPQFMTAFAEANRDGSARAIEVRVRRDDPLPAQVPVYFWLEMALSPVIDDQRPGDRHEVVALLRDVTERRRQDQEMRDARRLAEDASNAKSRFLATMGHELRTPLNAIVGFSEMMTSGVVGELSGPHREYAEIIHQSGHHLLDVVNMLLDMSRIEAGKFELQTDAFEPGALIEPCFKMVDSLARQRKVRLMTDLPKALPMITGDERACRQVLINLLSNAIKFSNENAAVVVSMKRQGDYLNISVADRGIGMEADAVRRIGEPFFQANEGLNRRYEGTGLGLSIVKGLVDLHQGTMTAVSSPGDGTVVTVLLPLNGPETKKGETAEVTPLHKEPAPEQLPQWQDERRRAL
ncbi:MAG TPA: PAS domain-containing sensor histidine kinase [Devosia sp.]|nr:PAS domain-containing sensor histidine kinase [Devosia sp.]